MLLKFLSLRHYYSSSLSTTSMLVAAAPSLLSPPSLPPSLVAIFVFFICYFTYLGHLLGKPVDQPMESAPALLASRSLRSPTCCKALAVCSLLIFLEMTKKMCTDNAFYLFSMVVGNILDVAAGLWWPAVSGISGLFIIINFFLDNGPAVVLVNDFNTSLIAYNVFR